MKHDSAVQSRMPIYLDHQASTPLDPSVLAEMMPFFASVQGNPHASGNAHGTAAMRVIETARSQVADLIGAEPSEIVFTSGATEANNMLIRSAAAAGLASGRTGIVVSAIEHHAVLDVVRALKNEGFRVVEVGVGRDGVVDLEALARVVDEQTALVSVMAANNEIGTLQPIADVAGLASRAGALSHSDAAQAAGKIPIDVHALGLDLLSLSAHKMYGPMGIGAAFVRRSIRSRMTPLLRGGGQEGGLRSGTLPVPLCAGFGAAARLATELMPEEAARTASLRNRFLAALVERNAEPVVNGSMAARLPGNLSVAFPGVDAEALMMRIRRTVSIATGSACTSASLEPSHVLLALGGDPSLAEQTVRVGFGRETTLEEVDIAAASVASAVARLRSVGYDPAKHSYGTNM